jgi:diguanylate cyclase (GGDEF)-like protein
MEDRSELALVPTFTTPQIEVLADPAFAVDPQGQIVAWNRAATHLLGWSTESAIGAGCAALLEGRSPDGHECRTECPGGTGKACMGATHSAHPNLRVHGADGAAIDVTVVQLSILMDGLPALLHILRPVAEFQRDPLTGLVGRNEVAQALLTAQSRARRTGETVCAALVDVDHLKSINDHYGHAAGDAALRAVARTLREGRQHDHVARWGGDEFFLLAAGATAEATVTRLERCIASLRKIRMAPRARPLSVSAGVTEVHFGDRLEAVVARADGALYKAKQKRATVCISAPETADDPEDEEERVGKAQPRTFCTSRAISRSSRAATTITSTTEPGTAIDPSWSAHAPLASPLTATPK